MIEKTEKIFIVVKDLKTNSVVDNTVGYTYEAIEECIITKMKELFYVEADTEVREKIEYFHYTSAEIYENPSFDKFLDLIDEGKIMYDIRIGSYSNGRTHDHGSGFRIKAQDLSLLYETKQEIE